ncbi:MAG: DUF799 family lipoprotein [Methylococcales bacterium]|nr:DUF799 family lipoprotein [Methylococcales bacterium]
MRPLTRTVNQLLPLLALFLTACITSPSFDYTAFRAHKPRSILVLPPVNKTTDVNAPYTYLSTITQPLAECGYYVFPVAVVDAYMKENGLPSADEMHGVSLAKIRQIIGADAVLYVTIEEWGQKYIVIQSVTIINATAKLVDTATGTVIWEGKQSVSRGSGGGGDPVAMLITAAVTQVMNSMVDYTHDLSRQANYQMVYDPNEGFLAGPYLPPTQSGHCGTN